MLDNFVMDPMFPLGVGLMGGLTWLMGYAFWQAWCKPWLTKRREKKKKEYQDWYISQFLHSVWLIWENHNGESAIEFVADRRIDTTQEHLVRFYMQAPWLVGHEYRTPMVWVRVDDGIAIGPEEPWVGEHLDGLLKGLKDSKRSHEQIKSFTSTRRKDVHS